MPTLLLSQRHSPDSITTWRAALHSGWDVERIRGEAIDLALAARAPVLYGETLLADALAEPLGLSFLEPTADWLPEARGAPWRAPGRSNRQRRDVPAREIPTLS